MRAALSRADLLERCLQLVGERNEAGIESSAREVYYRLVGLGVLDQDGDGERRNYSRVVDTIAEAKLAGEFPLHWLRDNLRVPVEGSIGTSRISVDHALHELVESVKYTPTYYLTPGRWYRQAVVPVVMVEKDTLEGTIRGPCKDWEVPYYVCRGYSSVTGLYAWTRELVRAREDADWAFRVDVLYIGDHDPEGLNIPEAARSVIERIAVLKDWRLPAMTWTRVALTKQQAIELGAPPMRAKVTSSRAKAYIAAHGRDTWEAEAMDAIDMRDLLKQAIAARWNKETATRVQEVTRSNIAAMRNRMQAESVELMQIVAEEREYPLGTEPSHEWKPEESDDLDDLPARKIGDDGDFNDDEPSEEEE